MRYDRSQAELAEYLNARLSGWLVMWSPYRRTFTAVALCTDQPVILDDADPKRLLDQARDVQREALAAARNLTLQPKIGQTAVPKEVAWQPLRRGICDAPR